MTMFDNSDFDDSWKPGNPQWQDWQLKHAVTKLIERTGEPPGSVHTKDTPERFLKAWDFWTQGYRQDPLEILKSFELDTKSFDSMVFQANIPMWSLCAHHLAPFWGVAHVGYVPDGHVVGLSKLTRVLDVFARRLQTQEAIGCQVADLLFHGLYCLGVGVVLQCRHSCMESRGVQKAGTLTITSALRGCMKDDAKCRAEFMALMNVAVQGAKGV